MNKIGNTFLNIMKTVFLIFLLFSFSGCSKNLRVTLDLVSSKHSKHTDDYGDPVPTMIRLYQLTADEVFQKSKVKMLFKNDAQALKNVVVKKDKFHIFPEKGFRIKIRPEAETRYIGIIAMSKYVEEDLVWKKTFHIQDEIDRVKIQLKPETKGGLTLNFVPTELMNSDGKKTPLPTSVRIYYLKSKERFAEADFNALWKKDKEALEDDYLKMRKVHIYPGKKISVLIDTTSQAQYLGIVGIFRDPDPSGSWKKIFKIDDSSSEEMAVIINRNSIETVVLK